LTAKYNKLKYEVNNGLYNTQAEHDFHKNVSQSLKKGACAITPLEKLL
jgi:hypothetical protein